LEAEKTIAVKGKEMRIACNKKKKASELLTTEKRAEVKKKANRRIELQKTLGALEDKIKVTKATLQKKQDELQHLSASITTTGAKTVSHRKAEKKKELYESLAEVWTDKLAAYRESMRARVEKAASEVFMECSNNARNYSGLKISSDFTIAILDKLGRRDLGSPGQWAIVAYSMLDALTRCSEIEFPMIVDTPGRSVDNEHLLKVCDHFLGGERQIFFLPEGSELDPDVGDERYAHLCAASYSLVKDEKDHTGVKIRVDNLKRDKRGDR